MCVGKLDRAAYTLSSSVFISPCLKLMAIKAISSQFHGDSQIFIYLFTIYPCLMWSIYDVVHTVKLGRLINICGHLNDIKKLCK